MAISKLPADVGDENGETTIDERKIRIKPLPKVKKSAPRSSQSPMDVPVSEVGLVRRLVNLTYARMSAFNCVQEFWQYLNGCHILLI